MLGEKSVVCFKKFRSEKSQHFVEALSLQFQL